MVIGPDRPLWVNTPSGPVRNPDLSDEEFAQALADIRAEFVEQLWQAAHDYEYANINGTAVGMLTIGVLKGLPISQAITVWDQSIWSLYYARKSLVTHEFDPALYDFSICGQMPYSIPELLKEVLG
jgi:hypothetical protein